ncbi:MAG: hypothetical protein QM765_13920 [Myxococcales bacterium]
MNPTRLRVFAAPKYPTKAQALASPELLEKSLPAPWRRSEALSAVAGVALLAQTACGSLADEVAFGRNSLVAPVPAHGEGVAGVGCVVISPPVFLSEEEALKVVRDEAAKRGLALVPPKSPVLGSNVLVKKTDREGSVSTAPFVPDLAAAEQHVAIEYVSREDADRYGYLGDGEWVSAYRIETRRTAQELAAVVNKDGTSGVYFAALYESGRTRGLLATRSEVRRRQGCQARREPGTAAPAGPRLPRLAAGAGGALAHGTARPASLSASPLPDEARGARRAGSARGFASRALASV